MPDQKHEASNQNPTQNQDLGCGARVGIHMTKQWVQRGCFRCPSPFLQLAKRGLSRLLRGFTARQRDKASIVHIQRLNHENCRNPKQP